MDLVKSNEHIAINQAFGTKEFGELLEAAMVREPQYVVKTSFAPSGLGYNGSCPRYWYYAFNGADFIYDTEATAMANMNAGSDSGVRLADVLEKAGILVEREFEIDTREDPLFPPIHGFIDAIVNWKGSEVLVEIKTTRSKVWNGRAMKNEVPDYQMIQLLIYMYVTDHDKGFFLTENKDTHEIFILPVKMTQSNKELVEKVFEWMREVKDNADNGELPTRPYTKSSYACKGCPVKEKCWDGYERGSVNGKDPNPGQITIPILEVSNRG